MKRRTPFRSRLSAAARPAFDRNRAGHRPAVVKTAQHSDGSGGHVRDCYPSMAARAAFPVIVDDSLPAILRYSRSDRRRSVANRAQWSTGIVVIARLRQQSRVRGASSLGLIRHCGGNGVIHGDLPWGWAGAQPVSRPSAAKQSRQQCRWSPPYGHSPATKRAISLFICAGRETRGAVSRCLVVALFGPGEMSYLSPQSGPKRTLV